MRAEWHVTGNSMCTFSPTVQVNADISDYNSLLLSRPASVMNLNLRMHVSCNSMLGRLHLQSNCQSSFWLHSSRSNRPCLILLHQAHCEEISRERNERQRLERDLEEASRRLAMAHQDIRRLTNELDAATNNDVEPSGMLQKRTVCNPRRNVGLC